MRVVSGSAKGRRLVAPTGTTTRPTSDAVREAIFNVLAPIVDLDGAHVADLFAGSGALGIEALSRGAAHCTFVDQDRKAIDAITTNLTTTGFADRATVVRQDVRKIDLAGAAAQYDVAFADPPYAFADADWTALLARLRADLVVAESDRELAELAAAMGEWAMLRAKRYGSTVVTLFASRSST